MKQAAMPPARDGFFGARWHGQVPLAQLLWPDMLLYGTAINVAAAVVALVLDVQGAPGPISMAVYLAPLPYNLFLLAAVWRRAADGKEPWATGARILALAWAVAVKII